MTMINANYSSLDQPQVLNYLFHPRIESGHRPRGENRDDLMIPVDENINIGASVHIANKAAPNLLFFHGNGEIVSDYDELGLFFTRVGLNFFVADYRGYGRSTGRPTVTAMMRDCHTLADFFGVYRMQNDLSGPLCVMGRSLGSASAIELASKRGHEFHCLIVESGFAYASPLLRVLGIDPDQIGFKEEQGFENIDKIKIFSKPCLVIHAQHDHIIPFSEGQALYDASGAKDKILLEIKGANHNDIFIKGIELYMQAVRKICFNK